MGIVVEKPGILTTVQDLGRDRYRRLGINPGGVMDRTAARLVNILLGNDENETVVETHFSAAQLRFEANAVIAVGGADLGAELDGDAIASWQPVIAMQGSVLRFAERALGNRAYLAVAGGFAVERWLGSSSTNLAAKIGGLEGRRLAIGDTIGFQKEIGELAFVRPYEIGPSLLPFYSRFPTVRVIAGAEFERMKGTGKELLTGHDFVIGKASDRMGFRLEGEPISLKKPVELLSSAVSFGTIQLLPDGQLIVLMADHQTTGGYPRIAHVISQDLPLMAQLGPGDKVAFHLIEHAEAEQLAVDFERELRFFRVGCKFQAQTWTS